MEDPELRRYATADPRGFLGQFDTNILSALLKERSDFAGILLTSDARRAAARRARLAPAPELPSRGFVSYDAAQATETPQSDP